MEKIISELNNFTKEKITEITEEHNKLKNLLELNSKLVLDLKKAKKTDPEKTKNKTKLMAV